MNTYEIKVVGITNKVTIEDVTKVKLEDGVYVLSREELVLFTAPTESISYIKVS